MSDARHTLHQHRIVAYDALRAFAIVSVVAIHALMPYRLMLPATSAVRVFDDLLHYAVPLFVFISGALVWARPWRGGPGAYTGFLTRRFAVIGLPFLAWSALYAALFLADAHDKVAAAKALPGLVLTGHVWYHLYFVPMLLAFYLLTPLTSRLAQRSPEALLVACYALRIIAGPAIAEAMRSVFGDLGWQFATHIVTHLPHMALGAWFALRQPGFSPAFKRWWPALLIGGTAVLLAASLGWHDALPIALKRLVYPAGMAATVLGMALGAFSAEAWFERDAQLWTRAGALAFGVYFVHPLFLLLVTESVQAWNGRELWLAPWFPVAVFAFACFASYNLASALSHGRHTAWLVGLPAPKR